MSVSDEQRRKDKRRVLQIMVEAIGDRRAVEMSFQPGDAAFKSVLQTTWRELLDDGLIEDRMRTFGSVRFRLTPRGWLRGLVISETIDLPIVRERCTHLVRALKAVVKGRDSPYDAFVTVSELAATTGVPEGWIVNALEARLLGVVFPGDRWDAHIDPKSRIFVRVSPTFGLNHLFDGE